MGEGSQGPGGAGGREDGGVPGLTVQGRIPGGEVHRRRSRAFRAPSGRTRFGAILAIGAVLIGSLVVGATLLAGDPNETTSPNGSIAAVASEPSALESAPISSVATPRPASAGPGIVASVRPTDSCLQTILDPVVAQANFTITWHGDTPLTRIGVSLDGAPEHEWYGGAGAPPSMSGSVQHFEFVPVGERHVVYVSFYGRDPGPAVLEVSAAFNVNPTISCYPDTPEPTPTDKPPLPPAQNGDVIAIVPPGEGDDRLMVQVVVVDQCLSDPDTALVTFRISWQGTREIDRVRGDIGAGYDAYRHENELGAEGRFGSTGQYERTVNVRTARRLWTLLRFTEELFPDQPDELSNGILIAEAYGPALFEPRNPCP